MAKKSEIELDPPPVQVDMRIEYMPLADLLHGDFQTAIIEVDKPLKSGLHPTTKPTELIAKLVSNSSRAGEMIYDLFGGSGTTMIVCEQLQRRCRMMEIEPKYCAVILQRMADMGLAPERAE